MNNSRINSSLKSRFDDFKLSNSPTLEVRVSFPPSRLLSDLADAYLAELIRVADFAGSRLLDDVTGEDIRKYLSTLCWIRCCHSVGAPPDDKLYRLYRKFRKFVAVPVLYYQVLIGIGQAYDADYAIRFVPDTTVSRDDLLSPEEMQRLSDIFFNLQNSGFQVVAGTPNDIEGELGFMAMAHVEEEILSYRRSHPVYGFLASFFSSQEVSAALGALVRVEYGYESDYRVLISQLISSGGGRNSALEG